MEINCDVILLAEDNEDHVLLIRRAFRQSGLVNPLYVVNDGEQAIAYLKGEGQYANRAEYPLPCLLLLDLKMPNKNGFEVLEWVREARLDGSLEIYALSGSNEPSDVERAQELGASDYITKPITEQKLRLLFGSWARRSAKN